MEVFLFLVYLTSFLATTRGATTTGTLPTNTPTTTLKPWSSELFHSDHDRDQFIMQLNTDVSYIKTLITSLFNKLDPVQTNPSNTQAVSESTSAAPVLPKSTFVAFMARLSNRMSGIGENQIIRFDDVVLNRGDAYDVRLGVFRCPLAGTYQFSLSIGSFGGIQLEIVNNGQQIGKVFTSRSRFGRSDVEEKGDDDEDDDDLIQKRYNPSTYDYWRSTAPTAVIGGGYVQPGSEATPGSAQAIVDLKVGDEVWVRHTTDNPHDILFANGMTVFSGHLLSAVRK